MAEGSGTLAVVSAEMANGFGRVADHLSSVRLGLQDLSARLAELDTVLQEQRVQGRVLDIVQAAARDLRTGLGQATASAAPDRVITASATALGSLTEIVTRSRMLDAVANLTLITAKSLRLNGFDDYVSNLRALGRAMGGDADRLGQAVSALRQRRERAGTLFVRATDSLDRVLAALDAHVHDRADTDHLLAATIDSVEAVAGRLSAVLAAETDALVLAMQFADAVAQRLDHVGTILSHRGAAEQALAAAQIGALVSATRETVSGVTGSLSRIRGAAGEAGRALAADSDQRGTPAARAIDLARSLLTTLAEASSQALADIEGAVAEGDALSGLADQAAQRFTSLAAATGSIHLAAINAALLSRTDNGQERAVSVLSIDVQQQAAACAGSSEVCKAAMARLTLAEDLAAFTAVAEQARTFRRAVAETSAAVETTGRALTTMEQLRRAATDSLAALGPVVETAQQSMAQVAAAAGDLAAIAANLPQVPPSGAGPLDHLMDLYTMEAERAVHRRLLGLPEVQHAPPSQPSGWKDPGPGAEAREDDPLAAILF